MPQAATDRFYPRVFALGTALLLGVACYQMLAPFLAPLMWAAFFAFLLMPAHRYLTAKLRNRPELSAWVLTLVTVILLVGPLAAFGTAFVQEASGLLEYVQRVLSDGARTELQQLTQHPKMQALLQWLNQTLGISMGQLRGWLADATRALLQVLANASGHLFMGALGTVMGLCLTIFFLFFFIRDGVAMLDMTRQLIPMNPTKRDELYAQLGQITRAVVVGTGLTALIQGALVGIAFLIVGLPSPLVFGVLAALLALLPFAGTVFVWGPAVAVLALQDRWMAAVFMLIWGALLVSLIDNFLKPVLISGRTEIATLTVFIGVLGGVSAFGAIGLFMGPVVLALALALLQFARERRVAADTAQVHHDEGTS